MKIFNFHLMPYRHVDLDAIERKHRAVLRRVFDGQPGKFDEGGGRGLDQDRRALAGWGLSDRAR